MSDEPDLPGATGEQRALLARLRAVIEAKDEELAALRASLVAVRADLEAGRELRRRLELRVAELERRLRMDSSDSGTPPSKEPAGTREKRKAEWRRRQESERERRKDRKPGGQPGHPGKGLSRDPDPDERREDGPPAQCSRCGADLGSAADAGTAWAQVWDVEITRKVTEYLLPKLACPCCGTVTAAAAPAGAQAGSVSYGPVLNAAAILLTAFGNVPPERAAKLIAMLPGMPVSSGFVDKASARLNGRLQDAGFDDAMRAALEKEPVLAADESPVTVLAPDADPDTGEPVPGAAQVMVIRTPDERLVWLQALASRRAEGMTALLAFLHRLPDRRRLHRLPAVAGQARRDTAVLPAHHPPMPCHHPARPWQGAVLGRRRDRRAAATHQAVEQARSRGRPALNADLLADLRDRYDEAVRLGIIINRLWDWDGSGNHPGYTLGCWLRDHAEQFWLFTPEFAVEWTSNSAERAVKGPKRHQAVSRYWHTRHTLARWCRIRSYLDSAANHGLTALDAITRALAGQPWLPATQPAIPLAPKATACDHGQ